MEYTKKQVEQAILTIADYVEMGTIFLVYQKENITLDKQIKELVYAIWLMHIGLDLSDNNDVDIRNSNKIISIYAKELHKNGYVNFA